MRYLPLILLLVLGCSTLPTETITSDHDFSPPPLATQTPIHDCLLFYGYMSTPFGTVAKGRVEFRCYGHEPELTWVTYTNNQGYYEIYGEESHEGHRGVGIGDSQIPGFLVNMIWIDTFGATPERYDFYIPPEP